MKDLPIKHLCLLSFTTLGLLVALFSFAAFPAAKPYSPLQVQKSIVIVVHPGHDGSPEQIAGWHLLLKTTDNLSPDNIQHRVADALQTQMPSAISKRISVLTLDRPPSTWKLLFDHHTLVLRLAYSIYVGSGNPDAPKFGILNLEPLFPQFDYSHIPLQHWYMTSTIRYPTIFAIDDTPQQLDRNIDQAVKTLVARIAPNLCLSGHTSSCPKPNE